jgi:hypothetical protein
MAPAPVHLGSFSLADSAEVVRRVEQVFACAAAVAPLPSGTLGWRRDSTFVDITVMRDYTPAGSHDAAPRTCWKGFRVDAAGRIFALPEKDWPYTTFRKKSASQLHA